MTFYTSPMYTSQKSNGVTAMCLTSDFYVYAHRRCDNGDVFYVGKGRGRRAWSSNGRSEEWMSISKSVGFFVDILHSDLTQDKAFEEEICEIEKMSESFRLVNKTKGGAGGTSAGYKHSDEIRKTISAAQKGRRKTETHKHKLSLANKGKKLSKETRMKMSKVRLAKKTNHLLGVPKSAEHKGKLSRSVIGKKKSNNKSGFVGVYFHKSAGRWAASITVSGKARHLGLFDTPEEASQAYEMEKSKVLKKGEN